MSEKKEIDFEVSKFTIGFDHRDRETLHKMWDKIFDTQQWSEGKLTKEFEFLWSEWNDLDSVTFSSWAGGAMAALDYIGVKDEAQSFQAFTELHEALKKSNLADVWSKTEGDVWWDVRQPYSGDDRPTGVLVLYPPKRF